MAGYSGTPLPQKLGIKSSHTLALLGAPRGLRRILAPLPEGTRIATSVGGSGTFDVIVWFAKSRADLCERFATIARRLDPAGGLWVAWPKKASKIATDLTEDVVRDVGLAAGLVDNKVCAIDDVWSGLRLVVPRKDRPVVPARR